MTRLIGVGPHGRHRVGQSRMIASQRSSRLVRGRGSHLGAGHFGPVPVNEVHGSHSTMVAVKCGPKYGTMRRVAASGSLMGSVSTR